MTKNISMRNLAITACAIAFGIMAAVAIPASAAAPILFGDATIVAGGNPGMAAQLRSDTSVAPGYGGATFTLPADTAWADLDVVSTDYNVTDDNCAGGSPRFQIKVDTNNDGISDGNVHVAIGPSPSFSGCTAGWQNTGNVIGNEDAGRYDYSQFGGSPFTTYSNAPASVTSGEVISVQVVVDGSWNSTATAGDSEQTVLIDNTLINTDNHDFEPESVQPTGEITNPATNGAVVSSPVNLTATYTDESNDVDPVQWAVRTGTTCNNSAGTALGNVDGHSDSATWDGQNFSYNATLVPGEYCFVFNPTDDPGQDNVRETRTFVVEAPANPFDVPEQCAQDVSYNLIEGTNGSNSITGTSGPDLILAGNGSDSVNGMGGNDCIVGGNGSDSLRGGNGNDVILGGNGSDAIQGNDGNDKLYGEESSDSISGGNNDDELYGGAAADSLRGDAGTDMLDGGAANDSANGGAGNDTCTTSEAEASCEL